MTIEISNGELIDKLTILELKLDKVEDTVQADNILKEWELLSDKVNLLFSVHSSQKLFKAHNDLGEINKQLWWVEDSIRENEKQGIFDKEFIELARSVYKNNDRRNIVKNMISLKFHSDLMDIKSYTEYS